MKIWLDDIRPMPSGYDVHCHTVKEAIAFLKTGLVTQISLDNDLGPGVTEGRKLAKWIEGQARTGKLPRLKCYIHTSNLIASIEMSDAIINAETYWRKHE
jgi:hypothetical protein